MNIDVLFKKYFYVLVGILVALAAYFQASGISDLAKAAWVPPAGPPLSQVPRISLPDVPEPSVRVLHEKNPFDHETGSLIGQELEPEPEPEPEKPTFDDPLTVPSCADVEVFILTESQDPLWSFAAMKGPGESKPHLRRVGDKLEDQTVAYIGHNPKTGSPTVWLESNSLCQAALFKIDMPEASARKRPKKREKEEEKEEEQRRRKPKRKRNSRAVDPAIAQKIKKISDTEFEIDRSAVDKIMENQAELMRSARIVPEQKDGKTVGVRLFGVRPETLLGHLGLKNGDRLETINGFNMGSPEKALEAYARLRTASALKIQVNRRGKPMTIELKIK